MLHCSECTLTNRFKRALGQIEVFYECWLKTQTNWTILKNTFLKQSRRFWGFKWPWHLEGNWAISLWSAHYYEILAIIKETGWRHNPWMVELTKPLEGLLLTSQLLHLDITNFWILDQLYWMDSFKKNYVNQDLKLLRLKIKLNFY